MQYIINKSSLEGSRLSDGLEVVNMSRISQRRYREQMHFCYWIVGGRIIDETIALKE